MATARPREGRTIHRRLPRTLHVRRLFRHKRADGLALHSPVRSPMSPSTRNPAPSSCGPAATQSPSLVPMLRQTRAGRMERESHCRAATDLGLRGPQAVAGSRGHAPHCPGLPYHPIDFPASVAFAIKPSSSAIQVRCCPGICSIDRTVLETLPLMRRRPRLDALVAFGDSAKSSAAQRPRRKRPC